MRRRRLWIAILLLLVAAAILVLVVWRRRAAPEAVRLLPEGEAVLYVNLGLIRLGAPVPQIPEATREPDYDAFVRETGFEFEHDLDEVALALHPAPPAPPQAGTPPAAAPPLPYRSSEIFVGRFQPERLAAYLKKLAASTERYDDSDIYDIPHEGRTVRVCLLGVNMVAVSNVDDPEVIRGMIERYHALAQPRSGPALVREHYARVPLGSVAWGIARIPRLTGAAGTPEPLAMAEQMAGGDTLVVSARYTGAIQLRAEAITPSEQEAKQLSENLATFLAIFRSAAASVKGEGPDPDVKAFFDSIETHTEEKSAVLTASLSQRAIQKVLAQPPQSPTAPPVIVPPETKKPAPRRRAK